MSIRSYLSKFHPTSKCVSARVCLISGTSHSRRSDTTNSSPNTKSLLGIMAKVEMLAVSERWFADLLWLCDAQLSRWRMEKLSILNPPLAHFLQHLVEVAVVTFSLRRGHDRRVECVCDFEWAERDFASEFPETPVHGEDEDDSDKRSHNRTAHVRVVCLVLFNDAADTGFEDLARHASFLALAQFCNRRTLEIKACGKTEGIDLPEDIDSWVLYIWPIDIVPTTAKLFVIFVGIESSLRRRALETNIPVLLICQIRRGAV